MLFGYFILLVSVVISAIAAYYSVVGLTAIFAAAVIPVMIMGGALEAGKIVATVWLHNNWQRVGIWFKLYLIPAIVFLMLLTSMGIFGFLSKAHSDQSLVSGDVLAKVAIFDEKIKIEKDNIETNRKALKQMDEAVDQMMGRSSDERGAERAVQIRRSQQKERVRLQSEIEQSQKKITALSEERAPIATEVRKVEAEVGPIKYIAALIYGDNPDQNLLEAAVRWVIILIVIVFDPLALTLILAGNKQLQWARAGKGGWIHEDEPEHVPPENKQGFSFFEFEKKDKDEETKTAFDPVTGDVFFDAKVAAAAEKDLGQCPKCNTDLIDATGIGPFCPNKECDIVDGIHGKVEFTEGQKEKTIEEFFDRARLVAKELDREEEQRKIDEANALLADIPGSQPEIDIIAADAEHIEALEAQQEELQKALDALIEKYDELAAAKDTIAIEKTEAEQQLEQTQQDLDQAQLRLIEAQTENATLSDAVIEIAREQGELVLDLQAQLDAREQELAALKLRMDELEQQSLEMASDVVELQSASPEPLPAIEPASLLPEPEPVLQPAPDERPGDYIVPSSVYRDTVDLPTDDIPSPLRRGVQQNFQMLKAGRGAAPAATFVDDIPESGKAGFGTRFPETAFKGDMFLRVDMLPNRAYKYNGSKWIEVDKNKTDRFAYDEAYIQHLDAAITAGEYELDDLNDTERAQLEQLRNKGTLL